MNFKAITASWQPTVSGLLSTICGFIVMHPNYFEPMAIDIASYVGLGGLAWLGISAKQVNVTGGTKEQV